MAITVEAVYEDGVLKPKEPLPLADRETVRVTVHTGRPGGDWLAGVIPCTDPQLVEWAATDADLSFPPAPEEL